VARFRYIKPQEIVERLRATIANIGNRVGGAAEFEVAEDKARLQTPALYVMLDKHRFFVVLHIDDSSEQYTDRRLAYSQDVAMNMREALKRSLVGWSGPEEVQCHSKPITFNGDFIVETDRADYYRTYQFTQEYRWNSTQDGLGDLGEYDDLPDFNDLCMDIIDEDHKPNVTAQIEMTDIHE